MEASLDGGGIVFDVGLRPCFFPRANGEAPGQQSLEEPPCDSASILSGRERSGSRRHCGTWPGYSCQRPRGVAADDGSASIR
jgi:hypothetical protein